MAKKSGQIYQIKVSLDDTHPPVWRRFLTPDNTTLLKLHDILQIVMGWSNSHLHMFTINEQIFGDPEDDEYGDLGTVNEAHYKLGQVIQHEGQRLKYEYDFGDSWEHTLLVEKILSPQEGVRYPICLKGKRACPPEDVGGVWGYENFLESIRDPDNDEHEGYLAWAGEDFDPEAFDLEKINHRLQSMGRGRSAGASSVWSFEEDEFVEQAAQPLSPWSQPLPGDQQSTAENLPLRRNMIALLTYLRDNKVTGTQSTGNLPLKAVHAICALFVNPPVLETTTGDHVYRVRSEVEVWSLHFLHVLAAVGGLVDGGPSRRWKLTLLGERYLNTPAPLQVWLSLAIWWAQTNWSIAFPYAFTEDNVSFGFKKVALEHLLALSSKEPASFQSFAERLIEASGLAWPIENQETARDILNALIERILVDPMIDFGILQTSYEPHKILGPEFRELSTLQITSFGRSLLEAIDREIMSKQL